MTALPVNQIINRDCLDGMRELPDACIDCVITDPPYGINYFSNHYKSGNPFSPIINDDILFFPIDELWRVLKKDGCMFAFYSHKNPLLDSRIKNIIIWVKNNWSAGDLEGDLGNQYECIAYMPKGNFKIISKRYSNVWHFDRVPSTELFHPTQKPIAIIQRMIKIATVENDLILDPFLGSGTTALAALKLNRRFIGYEISAEYCGVAEKRVADWRGQHRIEQYGGAF